MSSPTQKIYRLLTDSDKGLVLRSDLEYFQTHFVGQPLATGWHPPPVEVLNKSKPVRDFVSWMLAAPVLSERAVTALRPLISPYVEVLPLIEVKRKQLYAINVLHLIDCLDLARSEVTWSSTDPERVLNVRRFVFDPARLPADPVIFKVPEDTGEVFVSQSFVEAVIQHRLTGCLLIKPEANPFCVVLPDSPDVFRPVP